MASALYDFGKEEILKGSINLTADTVNVILVDTADYNVNTSADQYKDAVTANAQVAEGTLDNVSVTDGHVDADDETLTNVSGDACEALVLFKDTGNTATSPLVAYIDGISVTPNGGDIIISWDDGSDKIFSI